MLRAGGLMSIPTEPIGNVVSLGTTDDCGFAPFAGDVSTSRDIAFEKVRGRIAGTALAAQRLNRA